MATVRVLLSEDHEIHEYEMRPSGQAPQAWNYAAEVDAAFLAEYQAAEAAWGAVQERLHDLWQEVKRSAEEKRLKREGWIVEEPTGGDA